MTWPTAREAARAASVEKIKALLAEKPMTVHELAAAADRHKNTLQGHLEHMRTTLRCARPNGEKRNQSPVWTLGEDPTLPPLPDLTTKRDYLVAALFGPANREYKETA